MIADAGFDAVSSFGQDNLPGETLCVSCHERTFLRTLVAELVYKNQLLRFELSQSQAVLSQLRAAFGQVQAHPGSLAELQGTLHLLSALLKSELECKDADQASLPQINLVRAHERAALCQNNR